jgi:competence ComEA-like helix-hairpin-helix protein
MVSNTSLITDKPDRSNPLDVRIVLLLMLSLAIVFFSWFCNRPIKEQSSPSGQYKMHWINNSFLLTTDEILIDEHQVPAHVAPFYFKKININQASSALLQIIPGIGPALAHRIIAKRNEQGGFNAPVQLLTVAGIGQKRKEKLTEWLCFE